MAIIQNRLSTTVVDADFIPPEDIYRTSLLVDFEGGPLAVANTSQGLNYQQWSLTYGVGGAIILTPSISGPPVTILTVPGCSQVSFCFDQSAQPSITYVIGSSAFLYWFDSSLGYFTTTEYANTTSVLLSLDDKRPALIGLDFSDMLWWYTKLTAPFVYTLYHRRQRDRFLTPFTMKVNCLPYLSRVGMHRGLRGKIATRAGIG